MDRIEGNFLPMETRVSDGLTSWLGKLTFRQASREAGCSAVAGCLRLCALLAALLLHTTVSAQSPMADPERFTAATAAAGEGRLDELLAKWISAGTPAETIRMTLLEVVLPWDQPKVVRRWPASDTGRNAGLLSFERSAGLLLVRHSLEAAAGDELISRLQSRLSNASSAADSTVLLWQLAVLSRNPQRLRSAVHAAAALQPLQLTESTLEVLVFWMDAATAELGTTEAEIARSALDQLFPAALAVPTSSRCSQHLAGLALRMSRWHWLQDHAEQARRCLHLSDVLAERAADLQTETARVRMLVTHYTESARLLMLIGTPADAVQRLLVARSLLMNAMAAGGGELTELAGMAAVLQGVEPAVKYRLLEELLFLANGRELIVSEPVWPPAAPSPLLVASLPERVRERWFASSAGRQQAPIVPVAELTRTAVAAGITGELEERLGRLVQLGHAPAQLARLMLYLEQGRITAATDDAVQLLRRQRTEDVNEQRIDQQLLWSLQRSGIDFSFPLYDAIMRQPGPSMRTVLQSHRSERTPPGGLIWCEDPEFGRSGGPLLQAAHVTGDGVLLHQASRSSATCLLPWPVAGPFMFSLRTLLNSSQQSGTGFDGFAVFTAAASDRTLVGGTGSQATLSRTGRFHRPNEFGWHSVRVTGEQISLQVNGHPQWHMPVLDTSSPWLMMQIDGSGMGVFSDLELNDAVTVPREVRLSADSSLRGWSAHRYGQLLPRSDRVPTVAPATVRSGPSPPTANSDWSVTDDVIIGRSAGEGGSPGAIFPLSGVGFLQYSRPLYAGEVLTWEYEYQPGDDGACVALGSVAIQVRPEGVFVHGIPSDGLEWTMFPPDCEFRAGSALASALPVRSGWNSASLRVERDRGVLTVNDQQVLELPLAPLTDTRPGLCFRRGRSPYRVRRMVLRGDWPEQITNSDLQGLLRRQSETVIAEPKEQADQMMSIADEWVQLQRADEVLRECQDLSDEQRWQRLADWVLPPGGGRLRSAGVIVEQGITEGTAGDRRVDSPLQEWIRVAIRTGRLSDAESRLRQFTATNARTRAEGTAALALCAVIARRADAIDQLERLLPMLSAEGKGLRWLLLAVLDEGHARPELASVSRRIINSDLFDWQIDQQHTNAADARVLQLLAGLRARLEHTAHSESGKSNAGAADTALAPDSPAGRLRGWRVLSNSDNSVTVPGTANCDWLALPDGRVLLAPRSAEVFGILKRPIAGDFTFRLTVRGAAAEAGGPDSLPLPDFGGVCQEAAAKIPADASSARYQLERRGMDLTLTLNERPLLQRTLTGRELPWLMLRCGRVPGAVIEELQLETAAEEPDIVELPFDTSLSGWRQPLLPGGGSLRVERASDADWRADEARLVGAYRSESAGCWRPGLLQFMVPLPERLRISWSFRWEPGRWLVHPVVGDHVLFLEPGAGISVGRLSQVCGPRPEISAASVREACRKIEESRCELSGDPWQQAAVEIDGNGLELWLNGQPAAAWQLPDSEDRRFGFFHWSDQVGAEIRSLELRKWNRSAAAP